MQIRENNLVAQQSIYMATGQMDEYNRVNNEMDNERDELKAYCEEANRKRNSET